MTRPQRFLVRMLIFLALVVIVAVLLYPLLEDAFLANPVLNGAILGVLVLGVIYIFRQVLTLKPEADWIEAYRHGQPGMSVQAQPRLLAPMAAMLGDRKGRMTLSTLAMRSLLDGINSRLDEAREISRYMIGLLIFLGLLGTFWGLLGTINSVGDVIRNLAITEGDMASQFGNLQSGLAAPLAGMGTAFSSSLFGLAGSLVLGFLDLQAGQAQNRFYEELEDWLSSVTRLSSGGGIAETDQSVPAYVSALLEQTAESLGELQRTLGHSEETKMKSDSQIVALTEKLATLTDQMRTEQKLMVKLVENQMDMRPILQQLSDLRSRDSNAIDEASRNHIRNLDVYVMRLLEELASGRNQMVQEMRSEIKLLARTIAASADRSKPREPTRGARD